MSNNIDINEVLSEFNDREMFICLFRQKDWSGRSSLTLVELGELLGISATRVRQIAARSEIRAGKYARHHWQKPNDL